MAASAAAASAQQAAPVPPDAFAVVGGVPIRRAEVDAEAARAEYSRSTALRRLIELQATRAGLIAAGHDPGRVTAAELDQAVAELREVLRQRDLTLEGQLARDGMSLERFREQLRVPVALQRYVRALVTDEELRAIDPALQWELAGEARARHVVVRVTPERDEAAARARAAALAARLGAEPAEDAFAALAREASDDPLAPVNGGDLDWFGARGLGRVPEPVARACLARRRPGLLPGPVVSPQGVHVVLVTQVHVSLTRLREVVEQRRTMEVKRRWVSTTPISYAPDAPID